MFPIKDSVPSRSTPVATRALILVNVIVFFFELGLPHQSVEQLFYLFGLVPARFTHPDWALAVGFPVDNFWPILTHQFLHGGWLHIVANMWTLWIFGDNVEDRMGPVRFTIFYLLCGTAAGLAHLYVNPDSTVPSVGASGAIAGVLGAYFFFSRRRAWWWCFRSSFFHSFSKYRLCFIWPSGFSFNYLAGRWPWPARNRSVASPGGRTLADLSSECCHAGCL